jgi:hypothetical protein
MSVTIIVFQSEKYPVEDDFFLHLGSVKDLSGVVTSGKLSYLFNKDFTGNPYYATLFHYETVDVDVPGVTCIFYPFVGGELVLVRGGVALIGKSGYVRQMTLALTTVMREFPGDIIDHAQFTSGSFSFLIDCDPELVTELLKRHTFIVANDDEIDGK